MMLRMRRRLGISMLFVRGRSLLRRRGLFWEWRRGRSEGFEVLMFFEVFLYIVLCGVFGEGMSP